MRRFGNPPLPDQRYTHRPGAYAILLTGDRILLTETDELQLPGGGIDPGESPLHALHREVFEETGWRIAQPRRLGAFRRFVFMPDYGYHAEKVCHVYLARPTRCVAAPSEPGHRALFVPAHSAPMHLANAGDAWILARLLQSGA
ncbi:NUDIX hydrolase [Maribius pontilimi]|uniref:NUDIX hydrolase n=1 Tax=Palleronia pontilimi TaxID=1964209 RepID=A0A934MBJ3_9RHOB|nr:NUDIX hydrolase [Palleronia pontilimi]MBJ3761565.1 NUDIX hydrolase [Palleronia pontilimi]